MLKHLRTVRRGAVTRVTIDRPPVNAIDHEIIAEFAEVVHGISQDHESRAVVITGSERAFSAGADIGLMRDVTESNQRRLRKWIDVQASLEAMEKPVIAAIRGFALGGGAELALACDYRIAAEDSVLGFPEINLGLFPGAGGTQRLPRLVGPHIALRLMIEGRRLRGREALELGLVDEVVHTPAEVLTRAEQLAETLASKPTRAIGLLKRCVYQGWGRPLADGLAIEEQAVEDNLRTADAREGLAAFVERRHPTFYGQ